MDYESDQKLYILNEKNVWITKKYIEDTLKEYDVEYKVKDLDIFKRATVHKSYLIRDQNTSKKIKNSKSTLKPISDPKTAIQLQKKSYERLEFLGDSVLHCVLADYIGNRYLDQDEGFMTRLRTKIENGSTLDQLAKVIGLNRYILISRYIESNDGRDKNKNISEDSFEAFVGALYKDGGFDICKKFLFNLIESKVDFAQILFKETNHKDTLLQYFHKMHWRDPTYGVLDISGPDHKKQFTMYIKCKKDTNDKGEIIGVGVDSSKPKGEQKAAKEALINLGVIKNDEYDSSSCSYDVLSDD